MDLTKEFTLYVKEKNIDVTRSNYNEHMKAFKEKLESETTEMEICGYNLSIGDWVKVQIGGSGHLSGGRLEGKIVCFYPYLPQVKLESGWCFHPSDEILKHVPFNQPATPSGDDDGSK
jgi:hypothetical protein